MGLNFAQEAREADLRYGLVRVRENAESIAFYGGEAAEQRALTQVRRPEGVAGQRWAAQRREGGRGRGQVGAGAASNRRARRPRA